MNTYEQYKKQVQATAIVAQLSLQCAKQQVQDAKRSIGSLAKIMTKSVRHETLLYRIEMAKNTSRVLRRKARQLRAALLDLEKTNEVLLTINGSGTKPVIWP